MVSAARRRRARRGGGVRAARARAPTHRHPQHARLEGGQERLLQLLGRLLQRQPLQQAHCGGQAEGGERMRSQAA